jgi:hypothetical protein
VARILAGFAALLLLCSARAALAANAPPRAGAGPCREAVNGLISLLDSKADGTALYRDTYGVVVDACGPLAPAPQRPPPTSTPSRDACHDLAAALIDLIEDDKLNTRAFVKARGDFAAACRPR